MPSQKLQLGRRGVLSTSYSKSGGPAAEVGSWSWELELGWQFLQRRQTPGHYGGVLSVLWSGELQGFQGFICMRAWRLNSQKSEAPDRKGKGKLAGARGRAKCLMR
jgi:hypothetical protein